MNLANEKNTEKKYEAPAVIYDGNIGTRAGSPLFEPEEFFEE